MLYTTVLRVRRPYNRLTVATKDDKKIVSQGKFKVCAL